MPRAIEAVCRRLIEQNPKQAEQLRAGKVALMGYLRRAGDEGDEGRANPQLVNDVCSKLLGLA